MDHPPPTVHAPGTAQAGIHPFSADCVAIACQARDETAVKTNLTRLRGRSFRGERLYATAPFGKSGTQTFIAGLTHDALIAPWVITGAMDGLAFETYIETQLAPALEPGTVVILDNLSTHKCPRAARALKDRGAGFFSCRHIPQT